MDNQPDTPGLATRAHALADELAHLDVLGFDAELIDAWHQLAKLAALVAELAEGVSTR